MLVFSFIFIIDKNLIIHTHLSIYLSIYIYSKGFKKYVYFLGKKII